METTKQFVWGTSGRGESVHVSQLQPGDEVRFSDGFRTVVEVGPGRTSNHTRVRFAGDSALAEYGPSDWLAPLAKASEEN